MKLLRFGEPGAELPGIEINGIRYSTLPFFEEIMNYKSLDYDEYFFANGGINLLEAWIKQNPTRLDEVPSDTRLGPCVCKPSKIICIGLNYADHARETGAKIPTEPIVFLKATTALCGPNDDVIIPRNSVKTDWEVELAVVIGKKAQYVEESEAMDYVAGYCLHNDYSEREYQLERGGQWVKGKSCDTFAPMGPWLVTKDEIADVDNLPLWLNINGKRLQTSNTSNLIFKIPTIVSYLSEFMTLLPGDIISTGTPHGVGLGLNPPMYLQVGDVVELGIEGLGTSKQTAKAWSR